MWRGAERWLETEEKGESEFRLRAVEFEVPARCPGGAAQRRIGACGSAAQGGSLDVGKTKHISLCNQSPGKGRAVGSVLRRVRLLRTESCLAQVSGSWQGQFRSESPIAMDWGVSRSRGEGPGKGSWLVLEVRLLTQQLFHAGCLLHSSSQ